jgi:alpha 1,6-mannosyltransferase
LKSPSSFGHGAKLWRDGAGWLDDASLQQIADGDAVDAILGKPSVVVGIEADVGNREDWFDWWPRPVSSSSLRTKLG